MAVMAETPPPLLIVQGAEPDFYELCRILERIDADLPDGYRTEIIGGNVVVSPWSKGRYAHIMRSFTKQLRSHVPEGHEIDTAPFLFVFPEQKKGYGPDIHVADEELINVDSIELPGEALSLVGEVTSASTAYFDRVEKLEVYGKSGVPVYVLIDVLKATLTVYASPSARKGYQHSEEIKFGEKVHIPDPFDCELDTAGWKA